MAIYIRKYFDVPLFYEIAQSYFQSQGIDLQLVKFDNGTRIDHALAGSSLDTALPGAGLIENFAVQGNGVVFAVS